VTQRGVKEYEVVQRTEISTAGYERLLRALKLEVLPDKVVGLVQNWKEGKKRRGTM